MLKPVKESGSSPLGRMVTSLGPHLPALALTLCEREARRALAKSDFEINGDEAGEVFTDDPGVEDGGVVNIVVGDESDDASENVFLLLGVGGVM
jgi:hypothetical protein